MHEELPVATWGLLDPWLDIPSAEVNLAFVLLPHAPFEDGNGHCLPEQDAPALLSSRPRALPTTTFHCNSLLHCLCVLPRISYMP